MPSTDRRERRLGDDALAYSNRVGSRDVEFLNPYAWMSATEARVHLELERRKVPFTWRYFDAKDQAPHLTYLMPDFAPEFTLKEYKAVVIVQGGYFSTIPGVIDRVALAQALLEADGWKVAILFEADILKDVQGALSKALPVLAHPTVRGEPRVGPYGRPDLMAERRKNLSAFNLRRGYYALRRNIEENRARTGTTGRRRKRLRRERVGRTRNREGS